MRGLMHVCDTRAMTEDPVAVAARAYRRAEVTLERRRRELADAIGHAALVEGRRQSELVAVTGYTREHIRRITREYAERTGAAG